MSYNVSTFGMVVIAAIVSLMLAGVASVVLLTESGNAQSAATVLGFLAPTVTALFALVAVANQSVKSDVQHTQTVTSLDQTKSSIADLKSQLSANTATVVTAVAAQSTPTAEPENTTKVSLPNDSSTV